MTLLLFALGGAILAASLGCLLRRVRGACPMEDRGSRLLDGAATWVVLTFAVWTATSWALALPHALSATSLVAAGGAELAVGAVVLYRLGALRLDVEVVFDRWTTVAVLLALAPLLLWVVFVAWRGTLLPVYNHDALAYHLPKAVLLMKGHGFRLVDVPEARVATWPCNYELLLADAMILDGTDHFTAAVGTLAYVGLLVLTGRLVSSWWGAGAHVALATALVGATPIAILHSGLHKNDLLFAVYALGAISWSSRWLARACSASAILACLATLLAVGTKATGFFVAVAVLPVLMLGARRARTTPSRLVRVAASAAGGALALGAWPYLVNLWTLHKLTLPPAITGGTHYGAWSNVWTYTVLAVLRPFEGPHAVWNPFRGEYWWWPSNDVWSSHFGGIVSVLAILLVPAVLLFRTRGARHERAAASVTALVAYCLTLPIQMGPVGYFSSYGRYVVWIVPIVVGWTVSPAVLLLDRHAGRMRVPASLTLAALVAAWSTRAFLEFGVHDAYAPIEYVELQLAHPETRFPFVRRNRAASVFDANVGPGEACAIDVGYDTWIYPAYGPQWTRRVDFLTPAAGRVAVPDADDWVIVDRSWNVFFGNPAFVDMGKAQWLGRGQPSDEDLAVYRQLVADPAFTLVYDDRRQNQALFHRKRPTGSGAP